ncbi:MAG: hypothetical protein JWR77_1299 [Rhizorhabdus sp.]|nr:hypothetical protein [Rhizorhabdus sp.]
MRAIRLSLLCAVSFGAWAPAAHAQRQTAVGPGPIPLNAAGVTGGVDMSGSATTGTLTVGVVGGPAMDVYTLNNPAVAGRIAISTAASSQGNVMFNSGSTVYGAIGQTQPAGPFLLAITGGNTGTAVNFMGPVFATTTNVVGTGSLNFNSGSINISASNFAADGTIRLAPNTTLIGALTTTAGAQTGTLALGGGSTLDGAVGGATGLRSINVTGGSDLAGVKATITGATNAYAFSLGTNTLNIGGALTIANGGPSGVINTTLASPSVYGNIRPVGATNLGSTLAINVTVSPTAYIPVGSQFNIVQTQTGTVQSGTDGTVLGITVQNPTNPLYAFKAVPAAGTVAGLVTIETTRIPLQVAIITPPVVTPPVVTPPVVTPPVVTPPVVTPPVVTPPVVTPPVVTPPVVTPPVVTPPAVVMVPPTLPTLPVAAAVAPVLIAITPTPDIIAVLAPINAFSDPVAVVNAVAQLAPSPSDGAAPLVTFAAVRQLQSLWLSRFDSVGCDQVRPLEQAENADALCANRQPRGGFWMQGFGYFARQRDQQAVVGYDADIGGAMIAWDAPIGPDTSAGFGLGYANSSIHANNQRARTKIDSYQVTAYLNHEPGPWFFNGALSVAANDYSGKRQILFTGVDRKARASYNGDAFTAFATTGWHLQAGGLTITPLASLQYSRIRIDGYAETGAGDVDLRVRGRTYAFVESALGIKIARSFPVGGGTFVPDIHAKWIRELRNPRLSQSAAFAVSGSPSFDVPGLRTADDMWNAGAGFVLASGGAGRRLWSMQAGYDYYRTNERYSAHQGTVKLSARF